MNRPSVPLHLLGTCIHKQDFLNRAADRKSVIEDEKSSHWLFCGNSLIRKIRHGGTIVRQNNSVVLGSPSQDVRIV